MGDQAFGELESEQLWTIDAACDQFEDALKSGASMPIEEVLVAVDKSLQPQLFRELLDTELEHRVRRGESHSLHDYQQRFPDLADVAEQVYAELTGSESAVRTAVAGGAETSVVESGGSSFSQTNSREPGDLPRQFGRYRLLRLLGRGGMGSVYLAHDKQLDRQVALKVPEFGQSSSQAAAFVERFHREARAMATVDHPGICPIHDVGEFEGRPFLTMAYINGQTLADFSGNEKLTVEESVRIVRALAEGVQVAHDAGVLHRDLKPSNVMINAKRQPIIMDFGLAARNQPGEADLTNSGTVIGSPAYMAPEQVRAEHASTGPQTDVYALGVILYELLAGRRPFEGANMEVLGNIVSGQRPQPIHEQSGVARKLGNVCERAMAYRIEERYQSAAELADALGSVAVPSLRSEVQSRNTIAIVGLASLVACLVIALGISASGILTPANDPRDPIEVEDGTAADGSGTLSKDGTILTHAPGTSSGMPVYAVAPYSRDEALEFQLAWASRFNAQPKRDIKLPGGHTIEMMLIPPGQYLRGSTKNEQQRFLERAKDANDQWSLKHIRDEGPRHSVTITQPFYLGKYEVTQQQWNAVMGKNPAQHVGHSLPVDSVTWEDAQRFLTKLNDTTADQNLRFVLPTEAQWEYACRAGTESAWHGGSDESRLHEVAWTEANSDGTTHAVGSLLPNAFGLFDMHGNVMELCSDWSKDDYYADAPMFDPLGPKIGTYRVRRGGSALQPATLSRSARRSMVATDVRANDQGFRLAARITSDVAGEPARATAPFAASKARELQEAWATHLGVKPEFTNSIGMNLRMIPPGEFEMGCDHETLAGVAAAAQAPLIHEQAAAEAPRHRVTITKPFYISTTEVTRGQFRAFVEATLYETEAERAGTGGIGWLGDHWGQSTEFIWSNDPGFAQTDDHPVVNVTWNDSVAFCEWLSTHEGRHYALPTEAESEYACRAGTTGLYSLVDATATLEEAAWFGDDLPGGTHVVGQKHANAFGLFDMHGNVYEWCHDWFAPFTPDAATDPGGPSDGSHRVVRGGSFNDHRTELRSSRRLGTPPDVRLYSYGFRVALRVASD